MTRERRPAGAVVLTICVMGLGHLYAGRPRAALGFAVAGHAYGVASIILALSRPSGIALLCDLVVGLLLFVTAIVHAGLAAKWAARPYELRRYNRWWIYVLVVLFAWFVWQPSLLAWMHRSLRAFRIPNPAMEPAILSGDRLFVDTRAPARRTPQRNEVVILESIEQPGGAVIKRVIGVPGDTLVTIGGQLYRNGQAVAEPWIQPLTAADSFPLEDTKLPSGTKRPTMLNWGPVVVGAGQVFVMGDNRPDSYDSRFWGPLPADHVLGRPLSLYFSYGWGHIRWGRIGTSPWVVQPN